MLELTRNQKENQQKAESVFVSEYAQARSFVALENQTSFHFCDCRTLFNFRAQGAAAPSGALPSPKRAASLAARAVPTAAVPPGARAGGKVGAVTGTEARAAGKARGKVEGTSPQAVKSNKFYNFSH